MWVGGGDGQLSVGHVCDMVQGLMELRSKDSQEEHPEAIREFVLKINGFPLQSLSGHS